MVSKLVSALQLDHLDACRGRRVHPEPTEELAFIRALAGVQLVRVALRNEIVPRFSHVNLVVVACSNPAVIALIDLNAR